MKNKTESGRTLLETLAVMAIIVLFGIFAIRWFKGAVVRQEADRDYEDIMTTITSVYNRGTKRTNKGIADTFLTYNKTRSGKNLSISYNCPQDSTAITIKVDNLDEEACRHLMEKNWDSPYQPLFMLRAEMGQNVCAWNGDKAGLYRLAGPSDCTKTSAPEKGSFTVVFSDMKHPAQCTTNDDCKTSCGTCDEEMQRCVGECLSVCTPDTGCGENECVRCDSATQTCRNLCTPVEYLESTGTQWIDTGIEILSITPSFTISLKSNYYIGNSYYKPLYIGVNNNGSRAFGIWKNSATQMSIVDYARRISTIEINPSQEWNTIVYDKQNKTFSVDGTTVSTQTGGWYGANPTNFALFASNTYNQPSAQVSKVAIAYCKLYNGGVLVRDFIPVLSPDGVPAMFDRVEKKLYYNQGTGTFKTNLSN